MERQDKANKKRKINESGQQNIDEYHDYAEIPSSRITRINCALIKFFVACGISYRIVEHPFFIDFISELNAGYTLPTREYLSRRLLETELCRVNTNIEADLDNQIDLTLGKIIIIIYL